MFEGQRRDLHRARTLDICKKSSLNIQLSTDQCMYVRKLHGGKIPERISGNTYWGSWLMIVPVSTRQTGKPHNSGALGTQEDLASIVENN